MSVDRRSWSPEDKVCKMRSLFNKLGGKTRLKVVVCGLDGAGKTS